MDDMNVGEIKSNDGILIAIIVRKDFNKEGVNFISNEEDPLQLGISSYKNGSKIRAHFHLEKEITINKIQEVVYLKRGRSIAHLYDINGKKFKSIQLFTGDLIMFLNGGHGFEMLEDTQIIEVKQGPYMGKGHDKRMID